MSSGANSCYQCFNGDNSNKKHSKAKFTAEEDSKLVKLVSQCSEIDWSVISKQMKNRNARQCRERWQNYLNPNLNLSNWTPEEDLLLIEKYQEIGAHWNVIAKCFPGRSGNSVRNRILTIQRHGGQNSQFPSFQPQSSFNNAKPVPYDYPSRSSSTEQFEQQPQTGLIEEIFSRQDIVDLFSSYESHPQFL